MFTSNERNIRKQAQVDFTRSGWRQFFKLNRSLGARFLRGFVLRYELAAYLTAHEAAGIELDEGCQEVCYENGVLSAPSWTPATSRCVTAIPKATPTLRPFSLFATS